MYSERFRTIFVHIPRTGGQSVESVFLGMHNLTWKTRADLLLGRNGAEGASPQFLAHLYAREYLELGYVASLAYHSCFKFAVVRNPYDRVLSEYRYRAQRRHLPFDRFLNTLAHQTDDRHLVPAANYITDQSDKVIVDKILRFEFLQQEFSIVSGQIFGHPTELPHVNQTEGTISAEVLSIESRQLLYGLYERDFDILRYPSGREYHQIPPPFAAESTSIENTTKPRTIPRG